VPLPSRPPPRRGARPSTSIRPTPVAEDLGGEGRGRGPVRRPPRYRPRRRVSQVGVFGPCLSPSPFASCRIRRISFLPRPDTHIARVSERANRNTFDTCGVIGGNWHAPSGPCRNRVRSWGGYVVEWIRSFQICREMDLISLPIRKDWT
jgi:hypothetical protein